MNKQYKHKNWNDIQPRDKKEGGKPRTFYSKMIQEIQIMKRIKDINWVNFGFTFYPPPKKQSWEFAVWFIEQISKSE